MPRTRTRETYADQLQRLARSLAEARPEAVLKDIESGCKPLTVKMFTDGNLDKRFEKLERQVEFVLGALSDPDDRLVAYIKAVPLAAYDTGVSDGERFLQWLEQTESLSPELQDHVTCQRARHAVEDLARRQRVAHIHFQELSGLAPELSAQLESNRRLRIHLNPIRVWSRFETTALLDEDAQTPADVLFFPVGSDIHTAVLEVEGRDRIEQLEQLAPCTLVNWSRRAGATRRELRNFCRDLVDLGLVAFG